MSWMVATLLMDTIRIKDAHDFDSDEYNNLLIIEKEISRLKRGKYISEIEDRILSLIRGGYLVKDIETIIGMERGAISKIFSRICNRISFYLGGEFTDTGYIAELSTKHNLTEEQQELLSEFMKSNLKYKILRRPIE